MRARYTLIAAVLIAAASQAHAQPETTCGIVQADKIWQGTGVDLARDQKVCVQARGIWSHGMEAGDITPFHGPRGYIGKPQESPAPIVPWPYARIGTLLGKIDVDGIAFPIEDELCFIAKAPGELMLSMNDALDAFDDNRGALRVRITSVGDWKALAPNGDMPSALSANWRCFR